MRPPLLFLLLVACAYLPVAQAQTSVSEQDYFNDMPVVLSVSRLPQRLDETPGTVTVLDRDFIRQTGARDVADLLRFVPGFQVSNAFENVAPAVSYHGAFSSYPNRLEVRIDGRSVYSPFFIGSIGPGLMSVALQDIERIEVLQGSNSAAYGARAILGVINIVTRDPADTVGSRAAFAVGENGIGDLQASIGWGDLIQTYRLTADTRGDDGLAGANGQNRVTRINFRADRRPNGVDEVQLRFGAMNIDSGKGLLGKIDNPLRDLSFGSGYLQFDWLRSLDQEGDLAFNLSHSHETYRDAYPYALENLNPLLSRYGLSYRYGPSDFYTISADGQSDSDAISLQYTRRFGPEVRAVLGGELRREQIRSLGLYDTNDGVVTDFTRLFGNLEWRVQPSIIVNAGVMAEHASVTGDTLAPRLMVNWHMQPTQTLRIGVSKSYRPPSTFEEFSEIIYRVPAPGPIPSIIAPGNLQAEEVVSREVGYLGEFTNLGLGLNVRMFHEQVNGFIRQIAGPGYKTYANHEDFAIKGLEYQLKWQPWQGGQFILNQTHTDITSKDGLVNGIPTLETALAAPRLGSSLAYFQKLPGQLTLSLMHTKNQPASLIADLPYPLSRTDLRLAKALRWGSHQGEIALVVQNLGSAYPDYKREFLFERQAFVTLRLDD